jgi:arsenite-transporting ATPase
MKFLENPPRFMFFTGKGGVGKTSLACSAAIHLADSGQRVLLVSTDPASNVGQVFGLVIGNRQLPIPGVERLSALEIDPHSAAQQYRERLLDPLRDSLPDEELLGMEEQLSGACTTEIAAFDEFTSLLTDAALLHDYDNVIFDTAPTGHTIRMLQLPGAWSSFLEAGQGDASCLGPLAGLEKQRAQYHAAVEALADPRQTRLVLVARAEQSALREVARTQLELSQIGVAQEHLVVNGLMPEAEGQTDALAAAIVKRERSALANMPEALRSLPRDLIELRPFNMMGLAALRSLLDSSAVLPQATEAEHGLIETASLASLVDSIAADGPALIMLMGKGGVGKTTLAAAIAVELAARGLPVHLTTSDPAAHLGETLSDELEQLSVSRIDPQLETERYRERVMQTKGRGMDEAALAVLAEDLRSPCTEEVAVFQAFSRIIRESGKKFVVMDTAPTGHTLLLLDTTGSYHREITRQMGGSGMRVSTPLMQLQDAHKTKVLIVTLAESTPVLEAAGLQEDLRRAGIEPRAWIVNRSLCSASPQSTLLRQRAHNEVAELAKVAELSGGHYAVVPLLAEDPVGASRLRGLLHPQATVQLG